MMAFRQEVDAALRVLLGLPLSISRNAGSMKVFHFGAIRSRAKGTVGDFALHIQCPWRLSDATRIITGLADFYEGPEPDSEPDLDNLQSGKLQQIRMSELLGEYDPATRSFVNTRRRLVVEQAQADDFGGFRLDISGRYRLEIFPCGSRGESWRIFRPGDESSHFVIDERTTLPGF